MIRLLFTSGRGPAECRIAVRKAVAMLAAEAASLGLETDCLEGPNTDGHGPASAIVIIHGDTAAAFARPWIGAIQWVAQSPLRPHHKRKNWFIGVFELPALPDDPRRWRSRMSASKPSAPAAPAASIRTRPRARCELPISQAASPSSRGTNARSTETRRWPWRELRRSSGCRVSCRQSPRRTMRMRRMIALSAGGR
jgi:hypothetical protein